MAFLITLVRNYLKSASVAVNGIKWANLHIALALLAQEDPPGVSAFSTPQLLKGLTDASTAQQEHTKPAQVRCDVQAVAFPWEPEQGEQQPGGTAWGTLGPAGFISSGSMLVMSDRRRL